MIVERIDLLGAEGVGFGTARTLTCPSGFQDRLVNLPDLR